MTSETLQTLLAALAALVAAAFLFVRARRVFKRRDGCGCSSEGAPGCPATGAADRIRRAARRAARRA